RSDSVYPNTEHRTPNTGAQRQRLPEHRTPERSDQDSGATTTENLVEEAARLSQAGLDLGQFTEVHHLEEQVVDVGLERDQLVVSPSDPGTRDIGGSTVVRSRRTRHPGRLGLPTALLSR